MSRASCESATRRIGRTRCAMGSRCRSVAPAAFLFAVLAAAIVMPTSAAGRPERAHPAAPAALRFAVVYPIDHPFFESVTDHAIRHGNRNGVEVLPFAPLGNDVAAQIEIMEHLIDERVDGIALCATDPDALRPWVARARAAAIPVITFESDIENSGRSAFLGTDNYRAGEHLAHVLARVLNYAGSVIVCTGLPAQASLNQRIAGICATLQRAYPDVQVLAVRSGEGDPALTLRVIESLIADYPDFDAFVSIDATGGPVAVAVWKAKGWVGAERRIVTFDDMPENVAGLRDGVVSAIVAQKQWTWGPLIVERLLALVQGRSVPDFYDTGTIEVTAQNVHFYRAE